MKYCPKCGLMANDNDEFCKGCGSGFNSNANTKVAIEEVKEVDYSFKELIENNINEEKFNDAMKVIEKTLVEYKDQVINDLIIYYLDIVEKTNDCYYFGHIDFINAVAKKNVEVPKAFIYRKHLMALDILEAYAKSDDALNHVNDVQEMYLFKIRNTNSLGMKNTIKAKLPKYLEKDIDILEALK